MDDDILAGHWHRHPRRPWWKRVLRIDRPKVVMGTLIKFEDYQRKTHAREDIE